MIPPREVPDRDAKYMGIAWMYAAFSKDPSTQVGACIVSQDNYPLGHGYNGPPRIIEDDSFSWERPSKENPDGISKNDLIAHAEVNAIRHSMGKNIQGATIYVTALPCPPCMLKLTEEMLGRIVYFDFQSTPESSLRNAKWRDKSFYIAKKANIQLDKFEGNLDWIPNWTAYLGDAGIFAK